MRLLLFAAAMLIALVAGCGSSDSEPRIAFVAPDESDLQVVEGLWSTHPREQP